MKKLFFLCAFLFMSIEMYSQVYIVQVVKPSYYDGDSCNPNTEYILLTVDPTGNQTIDCVPARLDDGAMTALNQHLNNIISQGYKLINLNQTQNLTDSEDFGEIGYSFKKTLNSFTFFLAIP